MQQFNGFIGWLSPEVQMLLLKEMTLSDLMTFAKTREENKEGVKDYMMKRREKLFRTFVNDVDGLIEIMDITGTVISGSSALSLVQAETEAVNAKDLDVYTTEGFEDDVVKHFKEKENYIGVQNIVRQQQYDSSAITKIIKLEKRGKKVDIIVTHWSCAIAPIIQFHTTCVMNYITSRSLVCLYPCWTCANEGFINPLLYVDGKTTLYTVDALMKYTRRGFKLTADPWRLGDHDCEDEATGEEKSGYCPHKLRSTIDDEVLCWRYAPTQTLAGTTISCESIGIMAWYLGGFQCREGDKEETMSLLFVSP
ncbi:hypothetical protein DEU56DRAFT_757246 [Suillus clintonianus]|uniref:uncharacterized protein n=1 Tax=Suillus clintonianus TaxID=1904413 RepID=UPI001B864CE1|nr:uncharacterized protein DEU56DRAFT_757246 [Suillus clintonianus]KAG2133027.1 hypothetical protein DEU56DRAFT_757246 [Suillus clintonianus]